MQVSYMYLPHLHLAPSLGVTSFEFSRDFRQQNTRVPGLSCDVVCVILRLAVSVEQRTPTCECDRQTDIRRQLIPVLASVSRVKTAVMECGTK